MGAIVSDNDGAAFITKAEFDSLKNQFQNMIDSYNGGIDAKIDAAIASYLAGIKTTNKESIRCIGYNSQGVTCLNKNVMEWNEGKCDMTLTGLDARLNVGATNWGGENYTVITSNGANWKEKLISNDEYDRATTLAQDAEWQGFCETYITLVLFSCVAAKSQALGTWAGTCYVAPTGSGWNHSSAQKTSDIVIARYGRSNGDVEAYNNSAQFTAGNGSFTRKINNKYYQYAIVTNNTITDDMLTNNNGLHDWCNDTSYQTRKKKDGTTLFHTWGTTNKNFDSVTGHNYGVNGYAESTLQANNKVVASYGGYGKTLPVYYPGFDTHVKSYNDLYTTQYDEYISSLKKYGDITKSLSSDGKHLKLVAGLPLLEVKKDQIYGVELTFNDLTRNYDVWFKYGPYSKDKQPWNESMDIKNVYTNQACDDAHKTTLGSLANSVKVTNGKATLWFKTQEAGYLFMKFAHTGTNGLCDDNTACTCYPPQYITRIFEN